MEKPYVALVGRPNTGKSTLFNKLAGGKISIVEDTPGVTRDRIIAETEWCSSAFYIIDTGGIEPENDDIIITQMRRQAEIAMDMADVIVYIADGRDGITAADREICDKIRKSRKKCILAVNKIDDWNIEHLSFEFYELSLGEPYPISAEHGLGIGELLDEVVKNFPIEKQNIKQDDSIKIAIVGKPNVGKSSLVNSLIGEQRVIVSNVAGTTRDAIDTPFCYNEKDYVLIDTAGIKRKNKSYSSIDFYSSVRAMKAIERCDIVIMMIDAFEGVTEQDVKIAGIVKEAKKALVIVMNKWDLVQKETNTMNKIEKEVKNKMYFVDYAPVLFLSAIDGNRLSILMPQVEKVMTEYAKRISTGLLNEVMAEAVRMNNAPAKNGKFLKIYYVSQPAVKPPTVVLFVNDMTLATVQYTKYIEGKLRKAFGFEGSPINIIYRNRKNDSQE